MPDVHVGKGSTVGSVIPTVHAVIPAAVGVDIGCGMMAAKTTLRATDLPARVKAEPPSPGRNCSPQAAVLRCGIVVDRHARVPRPAWRPPGGLHES
jgi:hypothetical protein